MKAKKEIAVKAPRSKAASRNGSNGHPAPKKATVKKKLEDMTADEVTLEAWKRLYAKRDQFISMWD